MELQNLSSIDNQVISLLKENPRRSLSAMFRRFQNRLPLVGDIPLIIHLIRQWVKFGIKPSSSQISQALRYSEEYSSMHQDKNAVMKELLLISNLPPV